MVLPFWVVFFKTQTHFDMQIFCKRINELVVFIIKALHCLDRVSSHNQNTNVYTSRNAMCSVFSSAVKQTFLEILSEYNLTCLVQIKYI